MLKNIKDHHFQFTLGQKQIVTSPFDRLLLIYSLELDGYKAEVVPPGSLLLTTTVSFPITKEKKRSIVTNFTHYITSFITYDWIY
jgi:hypothetical protein